MHTFFCSRTSTYIDEPETYCQGLNLFKQNKKRKSILIAGLVEAKYEIQNGCGNKNLHISTDNLLAYPYAMGVQKGSPLLKIIDI